MINKIYVCGTQLQPSSCWWTHYQTSSVSFFYLWIYTYTVLSTSPVNSCWEIHNLPSSVNSCLEIHNLPSSVSSCLGIHNLPSSVSSCLWTHNLPRRVFNRVSTRQTQILASYRKHSVCWTRLSSVSSCLWIHDLPSSVSSCLWIHICCSFWTSRSRRCTSCQVMFVKSVYNWSLITKAIQNHQPLRNKKLHRTINLFLHVCIFKNILNPFQKSNLFVHTF